VHRRSFVAILLACAALALGLRSQDGGVAADPAARVAKAIADCKAFAGEPKSAQLRRALVWLGEIDHPEATQYLRQELLAAGDTALAAVVLEAIAKVARPDLLPDLTKVLERATAPMPARIAAADAILRLGDRSMDAVLVMAAAPDTAVAPAQRDAAITALIGSGLDRAHRGLAPLLLEGPMPARLALLRRMENVHGVAPVSAARIKLVLEGDLETAAVAWRQLAAEKHERAKALTVDVLERVVGDPRPAIAAELIGGLVRVRDEDF